MRILTAGCCGTEHPVRPKHQWGRLQKGQPQFSTRVASGSMKA